MYNKLFTKILDSSIWLEDTATRIVWVTCIAMMDEQGFVPLAAIGNIANRARVSLEEATEAVRILESPDQKSPGQDHDGRRIERVPGGWMVLNAVKYREMVTRAVVQAQTRERVKRHRAMKRARNAVVTPSESESESDPKGTSDSSEANSESVAALLTFPTVGPQGQTWDLAESQVRSWVELFPTVDVLAEARKALAWTIATPGKRKTPGGMPRFLVAWLSRATNETKGGGVTRDGPLSAAGQSTKAAGERVKAAMRQQGTG